jgi:hypothetical protein
MAAGLQKNSVFAIKEQSALGVLTAPSAATDFIALRSGFEMTREAESLENDEVTGDIGAAKPAVGEETVSGTHNAWLKNSGVVGQAPQLGLMYESLLGGTSTASTEYNTVASSTTAIVKVDAAEGLTFEEGEALMVKKGTGVGYEIRNINSISTDDLSVNFLLKDAPGTGVDLGRAILYKPGTDYPIFSSWLYNGNGHAVQVAEDCIASEVTLEYAAGQFVASNFTYEGIKYYFNPITITSSTRFIDWTDDDGTLAASVAVKTYRTPIELADAIASAMNAASTETYTVTYSNTTGKFTIATSTSSTLSLLWNTGTNAANSIGTKIGFLVAANDTGSLSYLSDSAQVLTAPYTPSTDASDPIVFKAAELLIGTQSENACVCVETLSITITKTTANIPCGCAETGIQEKIAVSREVTFEAAVELGKYDASFIDHLLNNRTVSLMVNIGPKSGGNWIPGSCVNIYMQSAIVDGYTVTGDDYVIANITGRGFVTSGTKDIFVNFI